MIKQIKIRHFYDKLIVKKIKEKVWISQGIQEFPILSN